MADVKSNRGGKRAGAGRKPISTPITPIDDLRSFNYAAEMSKLLENVDSEYLETIKNRDDGNFDNLLRE